MAQFGNDEIRSLLGGEPLRRRGFVMGSLASGFALSVAPTGRLLAQTIHTDSVGLLAGEVKIPVDDGQMPAYRAQPAHGKALATVLVIEEIFGVHEHIKDLCRRLAKLGFLAVAPELYARQGDPASYKSISELMSNVILRAPDSQLMSDLDATAKWATAHGGDARRLGVTGFCRGGRTVWLYCAHNPDVKAGVAWYGPLDGQITPLAPANPLDLTGQLLAPVLGLYGGQDQGISQDSVQEMRARLANGTTAAQASEIIVYPDAPHGFNADYRPSYRKADAQDGWQRMLAWFASHGVNG